MNRLEQVRAVVDEILRSQTDPEEQRSGWVHLYGVCLAATMLAKVRGLDVELCAVAGMLHDISTYMTNDPTDHHLRSAEQARRILGDLGAFSPDEIEHIATMILNHRSKGRLDAPLDEVLKDADVLQHYLYNPALEVIQKEIPRLQLILEELGLGSWQART